MIMSSISIAVSNVDTDIEGGKNPNQIKTKQNKQTNKQTNKLLFMWSAKDFIFGR